MPVAILLAMNGDSTSGNNCHLGRKDGGETDIAKRLGVSWRTIDRHVSQLVSLGWFVRSVAPGPGVSAKYQAALPDGWTHVTSTSRNVSRSFDEEARNSGRRPSRTNDIGVRDVGARTQDSDARTDVAGSDGAHVRSGDDARQINAGTHDSDQREPVGYLLPSPFEYGRAPSATTDMWPDEPTFEDHGPPGPLDEDGHLVRPKPPTVALVESVANTTGLSPAEGVAACRAALADARRRSENTHR